jgi:hypothetical protein
MLPIRLLLTDEPRSCPASVREAGQPYVAAGLSSL